jgi:ATP phosphoribosyltransferase
MEFDYSQLYAPVDLDIGHCRLSVAEPVAMAAGDDQASLEPCPRRDQISAPHPPPL